MFRCTFFFLGNTHNTHNSPYKPTFAHLGLFWPFLISPSASVPRCETPFRVNIHSHELTLQDTALWSIVHTSPASLRKGGDVFSKGGKERKKEREKKRKEMERAGPQRVQDSRWTAAYSLLSFRHFRDPPRPRSLLPAHRSPITIPRDHKTDQSELFLLRDHDG